MDCHYKARSMNKAILLPAACLSSIFLAACGQDSAPVVDVTAAPYECIAAKVTIGTNAIDTVVRFNKVNGEAQLLNAASFASKATGAQGNIIGWVPLGDLKNAVQELVQREQTMQQQAQSALGAATDATPAPSPEAKKK
jgi:predicted xylose isomerase-like sugar epimerase